MSLVEDYDSLYYRKYTSKSEIDKALNSLNGILLGISFDEKLNQLEVKELSAWCTKHQNLIDRYPFKDLMDLIKILINKPELTKEHLQDIKWLYHNCFENLKFYNRVTSDIQILQGICHGIISDGIIKDEEVKKLDKWLDNNEHLISFYPYDELRSLISTILSDGIIDDDEKKVLLAYFNEFAKVENGDVNHKIQEEISDIKISAICTIDPQIIFDSKVFCFTGVAQRAPRNELVNRVQELGGIYIDNVSSKTDYLIVGDNGNPCWAFSCYGRKVESAISLRKKGHKISIVHEFDFWDFVEDNS